MKKSFLVIMMFSLLSTGASSGESVVNENKAFGYGEKLTYQVRYNLYFNMNVGEVSFEIKEQPQLLHNRNTYHVISLGRTYRFFDRFFKVRDRHESFIDEETLLPRAFIRIVREGGYSRDEYTTFNHNAGFARINREKQVPIPDLTHDMMSAMYYARNFDYDNANPGDSFKVKMLLSDSVYSVGVRFVGYENVRTSKGNFRCIKLQPILIAGRVFESDGDMMLWVTDDANRVPVRIESGISVGAIRADLIGAENLRHELTALLK